MHKNIKNVYKIRFQRNHFETCNIWAKRKGLSVVIKILSPVDCLPLPGAVYIMVKHEKNVYKIGLQSNFFKPATNGQSDKAFLLSSNFCPQYVVCHCPVLYTCRKTRKNVCKIRFQRDCVKLCQMDKVIRAFCWHQHLSPRGCLPLHGAIYMYKKH